MRGLGFWVVGLGQVGGLAGSFELTLKPINTKRFVLHEKHIYIYIYLFIYLFIHIYIYTYTRKSFWKADTNSHDL